MHIDHAWKGDVGKSVVLNFDEGEAGNCDSEPPYGESIMIAVTRDESQRIYFAGCDRIVSDSQFRADLESYKEKTDSLAKIAGTDGSSGRLALAAYLRESGENHRALHLYRSLYEEESDINLLIPIALLEGAIYDGDPKPTLKILRQQAPATEDWQRKIDYTAFEAACELATSRKDWANVRRGEHCKFENVQLENADFQGADLGGVWFMDTNLAGANFRGANLFGTSFDNVTLTGAQYDCKTRYNANVFNPTDAGMINVEGKCHTAPAQ